MVVYRRKNLISMGDHGDNSLLKRMRAQGNCAEYAPFGVMLLAFVEISDAPTVAVHFLGAMLVLGRLAHAWGFSASPPVMMGRVVGMVLTLSMILLSALGLLFHGLF
ncbi:MAPEG family protein [Planktotalea sp.]|uniref:MAPEG family protein n=1 Tax=Planktotalea sp. TaxID=2029877 RepID=UPI0025ECBEBB|nr:MAPEG family protein [Planktotalea sp.]